MKTRLAKNIGAGPAADVYEAFLNALLQSTAGVADKRIIAFSPNTLSAEAYFRDRRSPGDSYWGQPDLPLGERLSAFLKHWGVAGDKIVLIGTDSPTLPTEILRQAFRALDARDVVLGPAIDGGYYLIGLARPHHFLFERVDWGTSRVFRQTVERAEQSGLSLELLPPWYDVDDVDSLQFLHSHLRGLRYAQNRASPANDELLTAVTRALSTTAPPTGFAQK